MPDQRVAASQQARQEESQPVWRSVLNGVLIFFAVNTLFRQILPQPPASNASAPAFPDKSGNVPSQSHSLYPDLIYPIWPTGTPLDISVYLYESLILPPLWHPTVAPNKVFDEQNFKLGDKNDNRLVSVDVTFPEKVKHNGTLWAHIFVAQHGAQMDPTAEDYDTAKAYRQVKLLTRYMPKKKVIKTKKLIGGSAEDEAAEEPVPAEDPHGHPIITSYWHSNLTLDVVAETGALTYPTIPPPLRQHVRLEVTGKRDATGKNGWYYPIVFVNDFWLLKEHMVEINSTVSSLPLHIHLNPTVWWKFQVYASLDEAFKQQQANPGLGGSSSGAEFEELKRVLVDTNIYLLATTIIVSILHTVFEMLAFKNDISHWRNKKDNVGVSFRTILANVFMQTVIFLYLIDNSDGTSWMILFGQGMGIILEAWKITKTVDVKLRYIPNASLVKWRFTFEDKHKLSALEKETKEYDEIAFRYLYIAAVPLLIAYAVYSLIYETHKSWYSFVITTLVGSVYAYGFLMMVPSLYINYRLKSVAHMPRKAMMYKFLNTFIDDLFAFTIKMPTLHRLATLRDDVIFFIYLYQAYVYKVDMKRINEFGQGGEEDPKAEPKPEEASAAEEKKVPLTVDRKRSEKASGAKVVGVGDKVRRR
ncbi:cleft lip and palate transmembrane protein 1-domain-containing protein [Kalaharituber pfeilii]|nr:cleft lip and palate transmembrane protein 1-domain-containing protein [Kalaharituber pfeilii]